MHRCCVRSSSLGEVVQRLHLAGDTTRQKIEPGAESGSRVGQQRSRTQNGDGQRFGWRSVGYVGTRNNQRQPHRGMRRKTQFKDQSWLRGVPLDGCSLRRFKTGILDRTVAREYRPMHQSDRSLMFHWRNIFRLPRMLKTMTGHDMPLAEAAFFIEIAFDEVPNQVTWRIPFPEACNVIVTSELVASSEMVCYSRQCH